MMSKNVAARNRRLAYLLVLVIFFMIGITIYWMAQYHALLGA